MGWRTFTPRAYGFGASAVGLWLTGVLTGVPELFMLAVAALVLPLGAWVVVRFGRYRLACVRTVRPLRATVGSRIAANVRLQNPSRFETGVLLLEDQLPYQFGPAARFVVPGIAGGDRETLHYELTAMTRGRYTIGPLSVRLLDPFGLAQVTSQVAGTSEVIVHPRVEGLPAPGMGGDFASASAARVRRLFTRGDEFYTTREYRDGDDLRKVHWRSSAKRGQLMIRQEEQPWRARALVAVDLRRHAHNGHGEHSSLERTISATASMVVRLARSGYELALVTESGERVQPPTGSDQAAALLDYLATVGPSRGESLVPLANQLGRLSGEGLLLTVLTVPDSEEAAVLARARLGFGGALALLVRSDTWLGLAARDLAAGDARAAGAAAMLERAGWRTAAMTRTDRLETPWKRLTAPLGRAAPTSRRRSPSSAS
ncbi:MAG TPA: DUF58 domain-containing protein [Actinomycetes bacterium]